MKIIDENTKLNVEPINLTSVNSQQTRQSEVEGESVKTKVSNFKEDGTLRLFGKYPQNYVDVPTYNLNDLVVINEARDLNNIDFEFILAVKETEDSTPITYTTSKFYRKLTQSYQQSNPYFVNNAINPNHIVVIVLDSLKEKIEELRLEELGLDINLTETSDKKYVQVDRNLFAYSNYTTVDGRLIPNASYDIIPLIKYIDWVVTKPNANYDDRLLSYTQLSESSVALVSTTEPSQNTTSTPPQPILYPPIGRTGTYDEEEVFRDSILWTWNEDDRKWEFGSAAGSGNQSGGYNGFN